jgi:hypothetical protein
LLVNLSLKSAQNFSHLLLSELVKKPAKYDRFRQIGVWNGFVAFWSLEADTAIGTGAVSAIKGFNRVVKVTTNLRVRKAAPLPARSRY